MYHLLLELAFGLLALAVLGTSASADPPAPVWLGSLAKQCSFKLGQTTYDLCPILEGNDGGWTVELERKTPPTVTKTVYRIDLQKPLQRDANMPGEEQVSLCVTSVLQFGLCFPRGVYAALRRGMVSGAVT